ncbi:Uncharacterised protein [Pseudomonas luteola]|uniref:Uncharacterized protein n=2 Tax=Pseudomonas TaxID=286 RepID=A0A2X2C8Q3_PSELU|nr:hypothetical protein SAMN05216409_12117 [Pseudomonas lutea]SPZ04882.1 Uncharacterised protein [Pseudomonas luteola]
MSARLIKGLDEQQDLEKIGDIIESSTESFSQL